MLHIKCPGCKKTLSLDDSQAGGVGSCPECSKRFRVPTVPEKWSVKKAAVAAVGAGALAGAAFEAPAKAKAAPKFEPPPMEDDDGPAFSFEDPEEDQPAFSPADLDEKDEAHDMQAFGEDDEPIEDFEPMAEDEEGGGDLDAVDEEEEEGDKKKKKKKKGGLGFGAVIAVLVVLWIAAASLPFVDLWLTIVGVGIGGMVMAAGSIWFLVVAFKESALQGILCLVVPGYSLYYMIRNKAAIKPFVVSLIGGLIVGSAIGAAMSMGGDMLGGKPPKNPPKLGGR